MARFKNMDERRQANFRRSYLEHITESAQIGIRHFASPITLGRKRKKSKHGDLDSIVSYLRRKDNKRPQSNDVISSDASRRRKRRKLRHSLQQIRNNKAAQNEFYELSNYHTASSQTFVFWQFGRRENGNLKAELLQNDHRCVLCLRAFENLDNLREHAACWHPKLSFWAKSITPNLGVIRIESRQPSSIKESNEWMDLWSEFYLDCAVKMRLRQQQNNEVEDDSNEEKLDIDSLHFRRWSFHQSLSTQLRTQRSSKAKWNKSNIADSFTMSLKQFRHRSIASLSNQEKLSMAEDVLRLPTMPNRLSKLSKFVGFESTAFLKKMMAKCEN